jgi:hypothetical protein
MAGLKEIAVIGGTGAQGMPVVQGQNAVIKIRFQYCADTHWKLYRRVDVT